MFTIDKLAYTSKIRDIKPSIKVIFSLAYLIICIYANSIFLSIFLMFIMMCLTVNYSQVSFYRYIRALFVPTTFLLFSIVVIAIDFNIKSMGENEIDLGLFYVVIDSYNIRKAMTLFFVALGSISCWYFIIMTTTLMDIIYLIKRVRVPQIIIEIIILMYKFIFSLMEINKKVMIAQESRLGTFGFRGKVSAFANSASLMLVRGIAQSNRLYSSMEARCYNGEIRVLWDKKKSSNKLITIFVTLVIVLLLCTVDIKLSISGFNWI